MTPEALSRIEQTFGVTLPDWYRLRLLDIPFAVPEHVLYHNEEAIVRTNQELRRDGWYGYPWPREFFVIGDNGFGDSYFIVPSTGNRRIFIAAHDGGPAPSFDKLGEMVQADTIEEHIHESQKTLREAQQLVERRRTKKWWQFWI